MLSMRSFLAVFILWASFAARPAFAQGVPGSLSGGGGGSSERVQAEIVRDRAVEAFRQRALWRLQDTIESDTLRESGEALLKDRLDVFANAIDRELAEPRMDGTLTSAEAEQAIGRIGESAWMRFEDAIDAQAAGFEPPPPPEQFDSPWRYRWAMTRYVLTHRNPWTTWVALGGAVLAGVLVAWICSRVLSALHRRLREREYDALSELVGGLRGPLYVTLALAGLAVGLDWFWIPRAAHKLAATTLKVAFAAALLWLIWSVINIVAQGLGWMLTKTYREPDKQTVQLIRKSLQLLTLLIYLIVVVEWFFDVELESVLLGVGLVGLAVSLAAQDSLKNLFGTLTILADRPFRVGDLIDFKGFFGNVEEIGFRSTKLREFDGHLVTIPNAEIVREAVQNVESRPWIRRRFRIGVRYDTPPEKVREAIEILEDILAGRDDEPEDMKTHIAFEDFGEFSLNILVQYCVEPGEYWDAYERGSELNLRILERFADAGIEIAFPTRTAVIEWADGPPRLGAEQSQGTSKRGERSASNNDGESDDSSDAE